MHRHPISDPALAEAILGLLIDDHPTLWSVAELERELRPSTASSTANALAELQATGLIHRCDAFVFATRTAHVSRALTS